MHPAENASRAGDLRVLHGLDGPLSSRVGLRVNLTPACVPGLGSACGGGQHSGKLCVASIAGPYLAVADLVAARGCEIPTWGRQRSYSGFLVLAADEADERTDHRITAWLGVIREIRI
jgi:hypothetical protein